MIAKGVFMIKNVLFVNTGTGWGGLEKWHYKTAVKLQERNYNIFILARSNSMFYDKCKKKNMNVTGIKKIANGTFLNIKRQLWLKSYLKNNKINAMFLSQSSHFKYGSIAGTLAGVEKVIYRRALAKPIKNKFYNKLLLKHCITDFMSISQKTCEENLKYISDKYLTDDKINLIYKGVEKNKFLNPDIKSDIRKENSIDDEIIIANIGRLCRQKAQQYLIRALPEVIDKYKNIKVLIVGGKNSKYEEYRDLASKLKVDKYIIFTDFREDIPSILKQIDFMVHTAIYEGGAPWVIIEAMMAGVPIVSTEAITISEFVIDNETGYLAEDKNPEDIADKIIKMIENKEREKMGERAQEIAKNKYTFEKMVDNIEIKLFDKNL